MSEDTDLQRIRAARLHQLTSASSSIQHQQHQQQQQQHPSEVDDDDDQREESSARANLLTQILTPEASDRLGRIALVNADRARDAENRLIAMARAGQLRRRATEEDIVGLLAALRESVEKDRVERGVGKVVFGRRKGGAWRDDEEDED
ncbi:DNA-binding TFAR19-related protein [Terfezia boudieri ATCC MYA-4762]|uniref:DNA-binding TFAR19-related protein n=1 Tax=Terfezia boudieri ATCC MYA-4762 TaxID=1051890 RepID=A0A3N4LPU3_9PEZI|nr:DNA-binding TFAR19-related protein [Terfezia boudieri ATCC MYA-4762]